MTLPVPTVEEAEQELREIRERRDVYLAAKAADLTPGQVLSLIADVNMRYAGAFNNAVDAFGLCLDLLRDEEPDA